MPITDTLKNAEDFRRVGFTQEQASVLAAKFEDTAHRQSEDLKAFIRQEFGLFRAEIREEFAKIRGEMSSLRAEVKEEITSVRVEMGALRAEMKEEIASVRVEMGTLRAEMKEEIASVRVEMGTLRAEMKEEIASVRVDMGGMRADFHSALRDQLVKIVAIVAALITAAVAIIKLVPPPLQ
jgi:hypothetical protein